jgi:hypothetical protein
MSKIWIELPKAETLEERQEICDKANKVLNKLGVDGEVFAPNETKTQSTQYIHIQDSAGSFTALEDNGQWFNLDYLSK